MDGVSLVRETWEALSRGDLGPLEAALAPDARWRAVEDGPWNSENAAAILDVMGQQVANGLSGRIDDVFIVGQRVVVAFRPDHHEAGAWPLDGGVRYIVVSIAGERVTEMKGCATREAALAYAAAE